MLFSEYLLNTFILQSALYLTFISQNPVLSCIWQRRCKEASHCPRSPCQQWWRSIKTSFLKGCSRPNETISHDGEYKQQFGSSMVACPLLEGLLWRDLFLSLGQSQEEIKNFDVNWGACEWRLLLSYPLPHFFYFYFAAFFSVFFLVISLYQLLSSSLLVFLTNLIISFFIFLCWPMW